MTAWPRFYFGAFAGSSFSNPSSAPPLTLITGPSRENPHQCRTATIDRHQAASRRRKVLQSFSWPRRTPVPRPPEIPVTASRPRRVRSKKRQLPLPLTRQFCHAAKVLLAGAALHLSGLHRPSPSRGADRLRAQRPWPWLGVHFGSGARGAPRPPGNHARPRNARAYHHHEPRFAPASFRRTARCHLVAACDLRIGRSLRLRFPRLRAQPCRQAPRVCSTRPRVAPEPRRGD